MAALQSIKTTLLEKWESGYTPQSPEEYEQIAAEAAIRKEALDGIS